MGLRPMVYQRNISKSKVEQNHEYTWIYPPQIKGVIRIWSYSPKIILGTLSQKFSGTAESVYLLNKRKQKINFTTYCTILGHTKIYIYKWSL